MLRRPGGNGRFDQKSLGRRSSPVWQSAWTAASAHSNKNSGMQRDAPLGVLNLVQCQLWIPNGVQKCSATDFGNGSGNQTFVLTLKNTSLWTDLLAQHDLPRNSEGSGAAWRWTGASQKRWDVWLTTFFVLMVRRRVDFVGRYT